MYNNTQERLEILWEKNYPAHARRKIDIPEISIYQMFKESVKKYGSREAIGFENMVKTYSELNNEVERIASGLSSMGLKKGDRIVVLLPNCPQYIYILLASAKIGVTIININPMYTFNEIKNSIEVAKSKIIFVFAEFITKVIALFPTTLEKIIVVRTEIHIKNPLSSIPGLKNVLFQEELPRDKNILFMIDVGKNLPPVKEELIDPKLDIATIHFTGGITGEPKPALISHYNLIANVYELNEWTKNIDRNDILFIATPPFFHVFGITVNILLPLLIGGKIQILSDRLDLEQIVKIIEKYPNVFYPDLPSKFNGMVEDYHIKKITPRGTVRIISTSSTLPASLRANFVNRFGIKLCQGYGLTEASPVVAMCPDNEDMERPNSVGLPLPNTSVRIVDLKTGTVDMPLGETGELLVKGPQVIEGFLNNASKQLVAKDGWLHTGDLGRVDENGYIYIMGRKKDMIKVKGVGVYPLEIEKIIRSNPKVENCAVIGVPDSITGESVVAFVEVRNNKTLSKEEILEYCRNNMYILKVPSDIIISDHLPKNPLGKVLKTELKKWYLDTHK